MHLILYLNLKSYLLIRHILHRKDQFLFSLQIFLQSNKIFITYVV